MKLLSQMKDNAKKGIKNKMTNQIKDITYEP